MGMENQAVRRRIDMIAGHFASTDDLSATATHIFPLNCSSSLNSIIRRCDNRVNFARQSSCSRACFMRQVPTEQNSSSSKSSVLPPPKCSVPANDGSSNPFEGPVFSRPTRMEFDLANARAAHSVVQGYVSPAPAPTPDPPKFARPNERIVEDKQLCSPKKIPSFEFNGSKRAPRMDVAESGRKYVIMLELPGVSVNDVRVEISNENMIVTGKRLSQLQKVETCTDDSNSAYHRREILRGPYHVVWPLPRNANKDDISAEFMDGFLRITIPKL